jgi:hypothetical protein
MATRAEVLHSRLRQNTDAWYADEITHEEFTKRQRATWALIESTGQADAVLDLIRPTLGRS